MDERKPRGLPVNEHPEKQKVDPVVEAIQREGRLTRDDGKNSIKALAKRFEKFNVALESLNTHALVQSSSLLKIADLQKQANSAVFERQMEASSAQVDVLNEILAQHRRSNNMAEEQAKLDALRAQGGSNAPIRLPNGNVVPSGQVGNSPQTESKQNDGGILSNIMAGAGGGLAALVSGYALKKLGRIGLTAFMAPIVGGWLGDFTEELSKNAGFSEAVSKSLGEGAEMGSIGAMIGSMFGARWAAVFGAAGFAASFADEALDAMNIDKDTIVANIAGHEITTSALAEGIMGATAMAGTAILTDKGFLKGISDLAMKGAGALTSRNKLASIIGTGVLTAFTLYSEEVSGWLKDQGMNEGAANALTKFAGWTAWGANAGSYFGGAGAKFGAMAGAAIGAGAVTKDYVVGMDEDYKSAPYELLDGIESRTNAGQPISTDDDIALFQMRSAAVKAETASDITEEEKSHYRDVIKRLDAIERKGVDNKEGPLNMGDIDSILRSGMENDKVKSLFAEALENPSKGEAAIKELVKVVGHIPAPIEEIAHVMSRIPELDRVLGFDHDKTAELFATPDIKPLPKTQGAEELLPSIIPSTDTKLDLVMPSEDTDRNRQRLISELEKSAGNKANVTVVNKVTNAPVNVVNGGHTSNSTTVNNISSGHGELNHPAFGGR